MKLESIALHHGYTAEPTTHAAAVPIYQPEGSGSHFAFRTELLAWLKTKKPEA